MSPKPCQSRAQTTPQQRSNLARKAARARWSAADPKSAADCLGEANDLLASPREFPKSKFQHPKPTQSTWLTTRFCLRLTQDTTGEWFLLTPAGLCLPASPAEISLWLDLQTLKISP